LVKQSIALVRNLVDPTNVLKVSPQKKKMNATIDVHTAHDGRLSPRQLPTAFGGEIKLRKRMVEYHIANLHL